MLELYEDLSIVSELGPTLKLPPPVVVIVASKPEKSIAPLAVPYLFFAVGCFVIDTPDTVSFTIISKSADFPPYVKVIFCLPASNPSPPSICHLSLAGIDAILAVPVL